MASHLEIPIKMETHQMSLHSDTHSAHVAPALPKQFGRYYIVRRLGQGGMATVYLAEDRHIPGGRDVALKVPHFSDAKAMLRFRREAQAAASLDHPNICPVYDCGEWNGIPYLAMKYVEGKPLSQRISTATPAPPRIAAELTYTLAHALQTAHDKGIVHRDLKPANILIATADKAPIITDFGVASCIDADNVDITKTGQIVGTPAYMSPEQAQGQSGAIDARSDVYSLGVVLYELLTGQRPFDGPVGAVFAQIITRNPTLPSKIRPDVDRDLEKICLKAMAKKKEDRYASMTELATALTTHLQSGRKKEIPWKFVLIGAGLAFLLLLASIIIIIRTRNGTIKIETDDPNFTIQIQRKKTPTKPKTKSQTSTKKPVKPTGKVVDLVQEIRHALSLQEKVIHATFAPNGRNILTARADNTLHLWEAKTGKTITVLNKHSSNITGVAISPDGKQVLSCGSGGIVLHWDLQKRKIIQSLSGHKSSVRSVVFAPNGKYALSGADGFRNDPCLIWWDLTTGQMERQWSGHRRPIFPVAISGNGKFALSGSYQKSVALWSVNKGELIRHFLSHQSPINTVALSHDGQIAVSASGWGKGPWNARVWTTKDGKESFRCDGHAADISKDGKHILVGSSSSIELYRVTDGKKLYRLVGHSGTIRGVVFSPDENQVLSWSKDETIKVWHLPTLK